MGTASSRRRDWCGLVGCPYPYVTDQILARTPEIPGPQVITENPLPTHIYDRMLCPRWGAHLRDSEEGTMRMEEEEVDVIVGDYGPVSVE